MSRYLCCSCICSSSKKKNNSNRDSDNPSVSMSNNSPLHDLMENPTQVDENVEYKIGKWQQAIIDFENLEVKLMMKLPVEGPAIISNLREHPSEHLSHPLELVRSLAKQRLEVLKIEGSLPSKRKVKKPNPRPSITNDANKFDDMFTNDSPHVGFYTERLSQIWSTRINTMDSTQGVISMADNELNKKAELFVRPKWPDFLTDVSYEVLKINKYGHQMRRILKLTQSHVVSIKNGNEVTKFYHYLDIRRVGLRKGNHIYVLQRSGKKNLYLTPIAPHILQQLTTRIQVRRSLDRAFVGGQGLDGDDAVYDLETAAEMIRAIAEENAADVDSVMTHFATSLRERTIRSLSTELRSTPFRHAPQTLNSAPPSKSTEEPTQEDVASNPLFDEDKETESAMLSTQSTFDGPERSWSDNVVNDPVADSEAISESMSEAKPECEPEVLDETVPIRAALQSIIDQICAEEETPVIIREESSPRIKSKARTDSATSESERSNRSPLLITFPENMPEHSVQEAVRKVIFDNSTPEGNTRKAFLDKFKAEYSISNSKQLMLEVRHFIDGMHEHIIFSRAYSLAMLYQQQRQKLMVRKSKSGLPGLPSALEAIVSQREQQKFQRRKSLKVLMENNLGPTDLDEELLTTISYIVFVVVEEATFLSLKEHLIALVRQDKGYDEESTVTQKVKYLSRRTQTQWGIPDDFVSPLGWRSASFALSSIEHNLTPTYQLQVLSRAVKAIYNEFKHAVLPRLGEGKVGNVFLGADDLVPIFLYVFSKSNLRHPVRNRDLMWALCHPDQLHGEGGYYLTIYESAIDFVLRENIEAENFLSPDEENGIRYTSNSDVGRSTELGQNIAIFFQNILKITGASDTDDSSLSMRESFA